MPVTYLGWVGDSLTVRVKIPGSDGLPEDVRTRLAYRAETKINEMIDQFLAAEAPLAALVETVDERIVLVPPPPEGEPTP